MEVYAYQWEWENLLSSNDLVHYLLEQNLISFQSLVDDGLVVAPTGGRNHNFRVIRQDNPSFFVKQALSVDDQTRLTLHREASWYQAIHKADLFSTLRNYLPQYYGYDRDHALLVVELVMSGLDLREYHNRVRSFPINIARLLAQGLAACHLISEDRLSAEDLPLFQVQRPWILTIDLHARTFQNAPSPAILELLQIVHQDPELEELLTDMRKQWRQTAVIHGDMKWDNCVVSPSSNSRLPIFIKLVDWEAFGLGDPGWDIGSIFHSYLSFWIWSMPLRENFNVSEMLENAQYPIEMMQPAIAAFWREYCEEMHLTEPQIQDLLIRSVRFSGARLIQTTYESMYRSLRLTGHAIYMIQLGHNLLSTPEEAIEILLGI